MLPFTTLREILLTERLRLHFRRLSIAGPLQEAREMKGTGSPRRGSCPRSNHPVASGKFPDALISADVFRVGSALVLTVNFQTALYVYARLRYMLPSARKLHCTL